MKFSEEVKAALWGIIDKMASNVSNYSVHPEKDFSRKKKWDFATLMNDPAASCGVSKDQPRSARY